MANTSRMLRYVGLGSLALSLFSNVAAGTALNKVDSWDVDGSRGTLYVHGALTESACRLAMSSAYQTVNLGTVGTGQLQHIGQTGNPVAIELRLEDCLSGESRSRTMQGNLLWSQQMPTMKIRFLAPIDIQDPSLAAVIGVQGVGLQLSDATRSPINLGEYSTPQLVSPGQNKLTYYVTPVRTSAQLNAGAYQALIRFQVSYE
ncbi:fimbrial protein [Providencia heimbachae]|uniref:MrfE family protein n=1 Tax=Providencia heimbachae ATCC 35613 TaxID=1354272 RepID=A0A1B7JTR5_9GAMM|nr:fimbrial protein [Providencia heimbachae]OAT51308.1 MrfE family protein [Providencia heimbachae ATCC 35613]SQH11470.1 Major fimbrial subunit precursor [Providencia heimbachae]